MDIKLENILLDDFFNIKLADLGTVVDISTTMGHTDKRRGTPHYMAPEVRNKNPTDTIDARLSDVYSLGVCLHLMLTGEFPDSREFMEESSIETESSGNMETEPSKAAKGAIQYASSEAKDLLQEMLQEEAFFRTSLDEVMAHPWLQSCDAESIQDTVYLELKARLDFITKNKNE